MITDELILRSVRGETTEAEEHALLAWRARAAGNEARYRQIVKLWELRRLLEPALHLESVPTAAEILQAGRKAKIGVGGAGTTARPPPRPQRARFPGTARLRLVASVVPLLVGAGILGYLAAQGREGPDGRTLELITAAAEMSSARLPDGSVVRLAPNSRLQVEVTRSSRRAWLHGRAFFAVEHDPSRPFRVQTHAGEVLVLGTRFDLEARSGELQLIVVDGAVGLASGGGSIQVQAGQLLRLSDGGAPRVEDIEDVYGPVGWIGNFVAFESTPLRDVARELEQRYGMRIQIHDSVLADQTVTSWSMDRSPEEILAAVCLALNAFCTVTDTLTTIER